MVVLDAEVVLLEFINSVFLVKKKLSLRSCDFIKFMKMIARYTKKFEMNLKIFTVIIYIKINQGF